MSWGDRREDIFLDDVDRHDFLKTLAEACQKTSWQVHAYCLMSNHYHVVLEPQTQTWWRAWPGCRALTPSGSITGTSSLGTCLAAQLVEGSGNGYLRTACDYVRLNPVRARLLRPEERLLA